MKFTHLSRTQIKKFIIPKKLGRNYKPKGCLWFACENDWQEWLSDQTESWLKSYKYQYNAKLDINKLIVVKTKKDIAEFTQKYGILEEGRPEGSELIDWDRVRKESGKCGILIVNPSIKSARWKYSWYSSFDVCSVAIWDSDAIVSMEETTFQPSLHEPKDYWISSS